MGTAAGLEAVHASVPRLRPDAAPAVRLVPIRSRDDEAARSAVLEAVVGEPFRAAGFDPALVRDLVTTQVRAQDEAHRSAHPDAVDHLVVQGDRPVGRCWIDERPDTTHVLDVAVVPEVRRRRIAAACLQSVIDAAAARGADVTLRVSVTNDAALALYRGLGFVQEGPATELDRPLRRSATAGSSR